MPTVSEFISQIPSTLLRPEIADHGQVIREVPAGVRVQRALEAVRREVCEQQQKWGEQNHPDGSGEHYLLHATVHKDACAFREREGKLTWAAILLEEVYEALAESNTDRLEAELTQVAAVCVSWIAAIRRRHACAESCSTSKPTTSSPPSALSTASV